MTHRQILFSRANLRKSCFISVPCSPEYLQRLLDDKDFRTREMRNHHSIRRFEKIEDSRPVVQRFELMAAEVSLRLGCDVVREACEGDGETGQGERGVGGAHRRERRFHHESRGGVGCDQRQVQTYSPQKLVELVKQHVQDLRQQMETLKIQLSNQEIEAKVGTTRSLDV